MSLQLEKPAPINYDVGPHNGRRRYRQRVPGIGMIGGQKLLIWMVLNFQRIIAPVGRRFGKTTGLLFVFLELAAVTRGRCYIGVWSQDHDRAKELMEIFIAAYGELISKVKRADGQGRYIELVGISGVNEGLRIYFWSASHPAYNRVRGFTHPFHLIVADESTYVRANAVLKVSLKMLADCGGKFLAIGTPDLEGVGFAWFSAFWGRAQSSAKKWRDWVGMNFPSEANPTIPLDYIETMRKECVSEEEEKQEIDALFLEDTSAVFGKLAHVFTMQWHNHEGFVTKALHESNLSLDEVQVWIGDRPRGGVPYVIGIDWGRKLDETIITVWRQDTRREVARFAVSGSDWTSQMEFLIHIRKAYGDCSVKSDAHGVGDGMTQMLQAKYGEAVTAVTWHGHKKEHLVRRLEALINNREIQFLDIPEAREQYRIYQGEKNEKTGRVRFSAPEGEHDDHVDAVLLVTEPLLEAILPLQDTDSNRVEIDQPKPGTMAEIRAALDAERVDYIAPMQIGPRIGPRM